MVRLIPKIDLRGKKPAQEDLAAKNREKKTRVPGPMAIIVRLNRSWPWRENSLREHQKKKDPKAGNIGLGIAALVRYVF
jgi:hypothetical protein